MTRHKWKWIGRTHRSNIYVDYSQRKTKIVTETTQYIHNGIYPFHNPHSTRQYAKLRP